MVGTLLPPVGIWPALAASNNKKPALRPPAAERCRQLAAAWLGDRPGNVTFIRNIDSARAIPACEQAVRENPQDADLKAYLCRALQNPPDISRDEEALAQCQLAADGGSPAGMTGLGQLIDDKTAAEQWYRQAAELGYPPAQNMLGFMYAGDADGRFANGRYDQRDKERDAAKAVSWYRKAAERGYPLAQYNLGVMYQNGLGVAKDEAQAIAWYREAIKQVQEQIYVGENIEEHVARRLGALQDSDSQAVNMLIAMLRDTSTSLCATAAEALGKLKDPRAVEPLIAVLRRGDDEYGNAAEALGKLKDPRAVKPLIAALRRDANVETRKMAAEALGELKDPRAVEPLIAALHDADEGVRKRAAKALGELKDPRAVEPLVAALRRNDDHGKSGMNALRALYGIENGRITYCYPARR